MRSKLKRYKASRPLSGMFDTVRPTSLYSSTYAGFPEDMDDWNCAQWKDYYLKNKAIVGKQAALSLIDNDISSIGSFADGQACKYDCGFMNFFKQEGLTGGNIFSKLYCSADGVVDIVQSGVGTVGGFANTAEWISNNKIVLLGTALVGIYAYKRFVA